MQVQSSTSMERIPGAEEQLVRQWKPSGEPKAALLLVHGIAEHCGRYDACATGWAEQGLLVHSFDLLGHGRTTGPRAHISQWSDFFDQVEFNLRSLRKHGLPTFCIGHSMGGLISLGYVLSERDPVDGLILSAPALGAVLPAWKRVAAPLLSRVIPRLPVPNELDGSMLSRDPKVGEAYFGDPLVLRSTSSRFGHELLQAMKATSARVPQLSVPTLVLHGGSDALVPEHVSQPLAALDNVTREVLDGLRHEILNEPEGPELVARIGRWIDDQLQDGQGKAAETA